MKHAVLALVALVTLPALAEDAAPLPPVVVIGTRSEQDQNRLPAAVTVITRLDIERMGAAQLTEVLRTAAGVQVTDFFGDGSLALADVRGFGENAHSSTLVLVDGRRLNNPDIAAPDLASVSLKDIERIEIIQGSGGALYGDQAVGGVINIVTRSPERFRASAEGGAGSYRQRRARGSIEQRWDHADLRFSAEARDSDNYRQHNALAYRNVMGRAGYDGGTGGAFVEAGYVDEDLETPGALYQSEMDADRRQASPFFRNDFSDLNTGFIRINFHQRFGEAWTLEADLDHRRANGAFRLSSAFGPASSNASQDREVRGAHPRLIGRLRVPRGEAQVTLGADGELSSYQLASSFGLQANKQQQGGVYGQVILPVAKSVEVTVGGRLAEVRNEVEDGFTFATPTQFGDHAFAPEAGIAWQPIAPVRLYARYDRTFRFAKVDEFTNAGGGPGMVNLRTQEGGSAEAGAEWTQGPLRAALGGYRLALTDEIAFDPNTYTNVNLARTRRDGVFARGEWRGEALSFEASIAQVTARITDASLGGRGVPLAARNSAKAGLSVPLGAGLSGRLEAQYTGKRVLAGDFDNSLPPLPAYAVINATLGWSHGPWHADARVNNALDRDYSEYGVSAGFPEAPAYYPSPERNVYAAARYDW